MESLLHRREGIIITLIEVLNELGLQGLSTREVAKRQGVSEATLFRHFKNKSEMMIAVLDHFSQYDDDIIETCANKNLNPTGAIRYFISSYALYYENYPAITAILQAYDGLMCEAELSEKVRSILMKRTNFLKRMIKEAQDAGEIANEADIDNLSFLIIGSFREICLYWRMNRYEFSLKDRVLSTLDMILSTFSTGKSK